MLSRRGCLGAGLKYGNRILCNRRMYNSSHEWRAEPLSSRMHHNTERDPLPLLYVRLSVACVRCEYTAFQAWT